jgi:hypothetical protein
MRQHPSICLEGLKKDSQCSAEIRNWYLLNASQSLLYYVHENGILNCVENFRLLTYVEILQHRNRG